MGHNQLAKRYVLLFKKANATFEKHFTLAFCEAAILLHKFSNTTAKSLQLAIIVSSHQQQNFNYILLA